MLFFNHYKFHYYVYTKNMEKLFFIIFGIITLFVLDIRITTVINYDLYRNIGVIKVKLFWIVIFSGEISVTSEYFKLVHGKKKVIQINLLNINKETIKLFEDITSMFIKKINLVDLYINFDLQSENPFALSIISGNINILLGIIIAKVQSRFPYSNLEKNVFTCFLGNEFYFNVSGKIYINIYDFVWAVARAVYIRRFGNYGEKRDKYERRKRKLNY